LLTVKGLGRPLGGIFKIQLTFKSKKKGGHTPLGYTLYRTKPDTTTGKKKEKQSGGRRSN